MSFIGKGKYCCVFRPPLNCKDNETLNRKYGNKQYVMKVINEQDIEDETKWLKILQKIDPEQKYFIYLLTPGCIPEEFKEVKCKVIKNYKGYFMKYGGITLKEFISNYDNRSKITIKYIWKLLIKVLYGIQLLVKNNFVHGDIKSDNFVIDEYGDIYIIDFGFMEKVEEMFGNVDLYHTSD